MPRARPSGDRRDHRGRRGGRSAARRRSPAATSRWPRVWPWVTFAVNVAGAFLLGYFATRLQERLPLSAYRRPLLGTGFCGALTTFSTMQLELLQHARRAPLRACRRLCGGEHRAGYAAILRRDRAGAAGAGWCVSAARLGRRRACSAARGAARFLLDGRPRAPGAASRRHARGEHQRRVPARLPRGRVAERRRAAARRHGALGAFTTFSTWMFETQRLDRGGRGARGARQRRRQPRARPRRGRARARVARCERGSEAHDLLRRARPDRRAFLADALLDLYGRHESGERAAARREGFGAQAPPAHRPAADAVGGPSAGGGAVDTRGGSRRLLDEVRALERTGWSRSSTRGCSPADRPVSRGRRGDEADRLPRAPGARRRRAGLRRGLRPCAAAARRRDRAARRRRHRARQRRRARFFGRNADVPVMSSRSARATAIARCCPSWSAARPPVVTLEPVRVCKRDGGRWRARRRRAPGELAEADGPRQRPDHGAVHAELVRRLRAAGAAGRTCAARHLGLPRRPRAARRPAASAAPQRSRDDDRRRHARADRARSRSSTSSPTRRGLITVETLISPRSAATS